MMAKDSTPAAAESQEKNSLKKLRGKTIMKKRPVFSSLCFWPFPNAFFWGG